MLSEMREESGGGDTGPERSGGDNTMHEAEGMYGRLLRWLTGLMFCLSCCFFTRYISLHRSTFSFPDTSMMTFAGLDIDYSKYDPMTQTVQLRYCTLTLCIFSLLCSIFVIKAHRGKYRDMLLTAGVLTALVSTTIAFNQFVYLSLEVKHGVTEFKHWEKSTDIFKLEPGSPQCVKIEEPLPYNAADYGSAHNANFQQVMELSIPQRIRWGVYCPNGLQAFKDWSDTQTPSKLTELSDAAVSCFAASPSIQETWGVKNGEGFYVPPAYIDYDERTQDGLVAGLVLSVIMLVTCIAQQFAALALSEANE